MDTSATPTSVTALQISTTCAWFESWSVHDRHSFFQELLGNVVPQPLDDLADLLGATSMHAQVSEAISSALQPTSPAPP
eukprot:m.57393 g.57393  ORF g.57393 m.57393 type:complete len:79 (+) comp49028_c0_seq1:22-258(+)